MLGMSRSRRHLQSHLPFPPCESPYHHHETKSFSAMPLSQIGTAADSICLKSRCACSTDKPVTGNLSGIIQVTRGGVGCQRSGRGRTNRSRVVRVVGGLSGHEWYGGLAVTGHGWWGRQRTNHPSARCPSPNRTRTSRVPYGACTRLLVVTILTNSE